MSIGKFNETSDSKREGNEANEKTDNAEKSTGKIKESKEGCNDDFNKKLDALDSKESSGEKGNKKEANENQGEQKQGFLTGIKNRLFKKDDGKENKEGDKSDKPVETAKEKHDKFVNDLRYDVSKPKEGNEEKKESSSEGNEGDDKQHGDGGARVIYKENNTEKNTKDKDDDLDR